VEGGYFDIVWLFDVYIDKGFVYYTLYFFTKNKISIVSQILNPDDHTIMRIMDNEEYTEIMTMRLWQEVDTDGWSSRFRLINLFLHCTEH
jgi:hypothetical protein